MTEAFASVLERVERLPATLVADWCGVPAPQAAAIRTQRGTASGGFVDLELRFAGDPPLLVWVKHGADLHDQQIESYTTDILAAHSSGSCVRLCLDEHYSKEIASQLRDRGRDVDCVKERPELVSVSDQQLWAQMQDEHRALLTENVGDFMPLITASAQAGETHSGIVFSNPRSMPRGRGTIGAFVESVLERA